MSAVALALALGMQAAAAQSVTALRTPAPPAPVATLGNSDALSLIRTVLVALSQANATGNYTVLRDLSSPEFQQSNTASRLGEIFKPLRDQAFDLSGVAVIEPQFTVLARPDRAGQVQLTGFFPSVPLQIRFDMGFVGKDRRWVLNSLSVALASSAPGPQEAAPSPKRPTR